MPDPTHRPRDDREENSPSRVVTFPRSREPERPLDNLSLELTSFVGRAREVAEVKKLLAGHRLITLTGPGGCGKTRLALAVASAAVGGFEDGAWWVELASLSDPALVPQRVAAVLGVSEGPGCPLTETLSDHLGSKKMLLVLDNCEHLVETCAALADAVLRACPEVRILATSREALGIAGESTWLVPSLLLPDPGHLPPVEELVRYEAIRLFIERAEAVVSTFELTEQNVPAVARLCRRLDGMPLAIELAAARVRVLSVGQISSRLEDSFDLLTGGSRTALPRHQTLRATMDWSHELLGQKERVLFRRLSVFAGGSTLEAAEEVCAGEDLERDDVLDLLTRLVDKSLVHVAERGGEARYRLLETVRQYGHEKLEESGEAEAVRRRHAARYLALAEQAEPRLKGHRQVVWMERLETEHDNLRAAMRWLLEKVEIESTVRLAWALRLFWYQRGHQGEGYQYAGEALEKGGALPMGLRAKAFFVAAVMSYGLESIERTQQLWEESATHFRQVGDKSDLALAIGGVGVTALLRDDLERASTLLEESVELLRKAGDKWGLSSALMYLGMVPFNRGDHTQATRHFEEALALSREIGNRQAGYVSLHNLALIAEALGDHEQGVRLYVEGLRLALEISDDAHAAYCLEGLAGLAGEPERAVRLLGASEALLEAAGGPLYAYARDRALYERSVEKLRSRLGAEAFASAWAKGRAMTPDHAVAYAVDEPGAPREEATIAAPAEVQAPPELEIIAFGSARVERAGHVLTSSEWAYARPKELLFYLLCHGPRTREQIGLALWPEASSSQLRSNLHLRMHQLRKALGAREWVLFEEGRYAFNRSLDYSFDVEAFEEELAEARWIRTEEPARAIPHLEEAIGLYRGDFLEDFPDSEWTTDRREELRRKHQQALLDLGELLFQDGRHAGAVETYRKAVAQDGYSETAHRALMRCYAAVGERSLAIRHYQDLVEMLEERLGSSPASETTTLYERLRQGENV